MKNLIYLNQDLKKYYNEDFERILESEKEGFWTIDKNLHGILRKFNKSQKIQTLYSKRKKEEEQGFTIDHESYLCFTFSEDLESLISFWLKEIDKKMKKNKIILKIEDNPYLNLKSHLTKKFGYAFIDDEKYFDIRHIKISLLDDSDINNHNAFWNALDEAANIFLSLSNITATNKGFCASWVDGIREL